MKMHPLIPELREELRGGRISRREFLRLCTLLGLSLAGASHLAGCVSAPTLESPTSNAYPAPTRPSVVRGGMLKAATRIEGIDLPARFTQVSQSQAWRHVLEYLTYTDPNGITRPYLLENWEPSPDLMTWTLHLKKGIRFNNGQELTADDVLFNFNLWLDKEIDSPLRSMLDYLDPDGQEKQDNYTIVCRLNAPTIFLPEHLFSFQAAILSKEFDGDVTHAPAGTGAFVLAEYVPGERCRLKARPDYWRSGKDDRPLPYLDEILLVQLGEDRSMDLAALQTGQVDTILEPSFSAWQAVNEDARYEVISTPTCTTRTLRFRVDQEPWTDIRVRQALKYCHNREKILAAALENQGVIGNDSHVSPAQPEYVEISPFPFDPEKSKALLAEAGFPNGVGVELVVAENWPESIAYAQTLQEDAGAGGFTITLKRIPSGEYWDHWTEWNLGITAWPHRPPPLTILPLAYGADAQGTPAAWNETRWVDQEFNNILRRALSTLDLAERKSQVGKLEEIQKERGSICAPFFMNVWKIYAKEIHGVVPSPEEYANFYETWKEA